MHIYGLLFRVYLRALSVTQTTQPRMITRQVTQKVRGCGKKLQSINLKYYPSISRWDKKSHSFSHRLPSVSAEIWIRHLPNKSQKLNRSNRTALSTGLHIVVRAKRRKRRH